MKRPVIEESTQLSPTKAQKRTTISSLYRNLATTSCANLRSELYDATPENTLSRLLRYDTAEYPSVSAHVQSALAKNKSLTIEQRSELNDYIHGIKNTLHPVLLHYNDNKALSQHFTKLTIERTSHHTRVGIEHALSFCYRGQQQYYQNWSPLHFLANICESVSFTQIITKLSAEGHKKTALIQCMDEQFKGATPLVFAALHLDNKSVQRYLKKLPADLLVQACQIPLSAQADSLKRFNSVFELCLKTRDYVVINTLITTIPMESLHQFIQDCKSMDATTLLKNNSTLKQNENLLEELVNKIETIFAFGQFLDYLKMIVQYPAYGHLVRKLKDALTIFSRLNPKEKNNGELIVNARTAVNDPPSVKEKQRFNNPYGYINLRDSMLAKEKYLQFALEQCRPTFIAFFKKNIELLKKESVVSEEEDDIKAEESDKKKVTFNL